MGQQRISGFGRMYGTKENRGGKPHARIWPKEAAGDCAFRCSSYQRMPVLRVRRRASHGGFANCTLSRLCEVPSFYSQLVSHFFLAELSVLSTQSEVGINHRVPEGETRKRRAPKKKRKKTRTRSRENQQTKKGIARGIPDPSLRLRLKVGKGDRQRRNRDGSQETGGGETPAPLEKGDSRLKRSWARGLSDMNLENRRHVVHVQEMSHSLRIQ